MGVGTETMPLLGQEFETQTDLGDVQPDLSREKDNVLKFNNDQVS